MTLELMMFIVRLHPGHSLNEEWGQIFTLYIHYTLYIKY
jgi:hypothetical protein